MSKSQAKSTRNSDQPSNVEQAIRNALSRIDYFLYDSGAVTPLPGSPYRAACDKLLETQSPSVKTLMLFLSFYRLADSSFEFNGVPMGYRGGKGDKLLCEELTKRSITMHGQITSFGENLGIKGNQANFRFDGDPRLASFAGTVRTASPKDQKKIANYLASRFAESKMEIPPLPSVGKDVLTFFRAKDLFYRLLAINSEGHIQQFLVTALLKEFRSPQGVRVMTHHPHAADKSDETAGDIEEQTDLGIVRAYEVTMRSDWSNRISGFRAKMDKFGLSKYTIVANGVNKDDTWSVPASAALAVEEHGRDIAVIDIYDVVHFLLAELSPDQIRSSVNEAFDLLSNPRLSGRTEFMQRYRDTVGDWLDMPSAAESLQDS